MPLTFGRDIAPDESIVSQRKDPDQYPELAHLSDVYGRIRLYREWSFGRTSVFRSPQSADLPSDRLEEKSRDNWDKPAGAEDEQVLLMTTCKMQGNPPPSGLFLRLAIRRRIR